MHRLFAWFCAAMVCCTAAPEMFPEALTVCAAEQDEAFVSGYLRYRIREDEEQKTVIITGYTDDMPAEVVIPAKLDGIKVESVGRNAFAGCTGLKKLTVSENVKFIEERAFQDCSDLTEILLPDTLLQISTGAFSGCTALSSCKIPEQVKLIGNSAFTNCIALTELTLPDGLTWIRASAFSGCSALKSVCLPEKLEQLEGAAFENCTALSKIMIPESLGKIGGRAFRGTAWLAEKQKENPFVTVNGILIDAQTCSGAAVIPDDVMKIGAWSFAGNRTLTEVTVPAQVTAIQSYAFESCPNLERMTVLNSQASFGTKALAVGSNVTVFGYEGSTAQRFAEQYRIRFESLGAEPVLSRLTGDFDGDSTVTAADAQAVLAAYAAMLAGSDDLDASVKAACDIDGDGTISAADAQMILIYYTENCLAGNPVTWDALRQNQKGALKNEQDRNTGASRR